MPGLLGPMPGVEHEDRQTFPHLEMLLARADRHVEPVGYANGLFSLFGIEVFAGADIPTAAVCFLADTGEAPQGFLLHADPLQLFPDRDRLLAFDLDDDPLGSEEIAQLVATFNAHFNDDGLRLLGSPSGRIYLHCDRAPSVRTQPLSAVIGRDLDRNLPNGEDQGRWRGLLNETQMLCHTLELNRERETRGRLVLGGLWFSGGGELPPGRRASVTRLAGDCELARGLLALCKDAGGDELIVERAPGRAVMRADARAWLQALEELEGRMPGLLRDCEALHVHPGNGTVYCWHARAARRWWRRKRSLLDCLDASREAPGGPRDVKGL
ncbi:MAG: hypothetical protein KDI22_07715 [Gammaproteobacteria bacterium]|nr:hypothetical protein [Gammaproteobacteria bacterium]